MEAINVRPVTGLVRPQHDIIQTSVSAAYRLLAVHSMAIAEESITRLMKLALIRNIVSLVCQWSNPACLSVGEIRNVVVTECSILCWVCEERASWVRKSPPIHSLVTIHEIVLRKGSAYQDILAAQRYSLSLAEDTQQSHGILAKLIP